MSHTWREWIAPAIAAAIDEADRRGLHDKERERFVRRESSPGHAQGCWPYRVWCDEVRRQLGTKPKKVKPEPPLPLFLEDNHE